MANTHFSLNSIWPNGIKKDSDGYTVSLKYSFTGCSSLSDLKINDLPKLSTISNGFSGTQLNKKSILRLLNQLPTWTSGTHNATIGIHVDHQNDEEVLAGISNAEAKGWTLTVQWTGTPTSTASTFVMGTLIYAKVGEIEHPDGTTEKYLDWGHYVTNWEERGYEQFRSLESAYEYFGLEMNN